MHKPYISYVGWGNTGENTLVPLSFSPSICPIKPAHDLPSFNHSDNLLNKGDAEREFSCSGMSERCFVSSSASMHPARADTVSTVEKQQCHETACLGITTIRISLLEKLFFKHCKEKKPNRTTDKHKSLSMLSYSVLWPRMFQIISHS